MKKCKFHAMAIFLVILAIMAGPELVLAKGSGKSMGGAQGPGMSMTPSKSAYQHQYQSQNRYQYRQERNLSDQDNSVSKGDQTKIRDRIQLRDPAAHDGEVSE
jgi:hypothetical protein